LQMPPVDGDSTERSMQLAYSKLPDRQG
jgi:hypothetical protein